MKKKKEFIEINQEKLYRSVENYNYYNMYGYFQEQCRFIKMNKNISYHSRRIDFFLMFHFIKPTDTTNNICKPRDNRITI